MYAWSRISPSTHSHHPSLSFTPVGRRHGYDDGRFWRPRGSSRVAGRGRCQHGPAGQGAMSRCMSARLSLPRPTLTIPLSPRTPLRQDGRTALMVAAQGGHTVAVEALVGGGANMDLQDSEVPLRSCTGPCSCTAWTWAILSVGVLCSSVGACARVLTSARPHPPLSPSPFSRNVL